MVFIRSSVPALLRLTTALLLSAEANAQNIVERWNSVEVPPAPELRRAVIDPETTALLVMGFVEQSCNTERRPRCVETIPAVRSLLDGARARGVFIMFSVPSNDPAGEEIVDALARLPGEELIPPNGPNKFLPYDLEFNRFEGLDLDATLKKRTALKP